MASIYNPPKFDCPTLQNLNVNVLSIEDTSPQEHANRWLSALEVSISSENLDSLTSLFHQNGFWKDILALTWDLRTIRGHVPIRRMLSTCLTTSGLSAFRLLEDEIRGPKIIKPFPGLLFVRFGFGFETTHGRGIAVVFLVPAPNGVWTAWSLLTRLHALKAHPEKVESLRARPSDVPCDSWENRRRGKTDFVDGDPTVLVIGAGHNGLEVAARLTCLGVPTLVIERNRRVGDNWRMRYKTLHLHNTKWYNQMPYLDFPETCPVYCSASELGDWLEHYATTLDLNVWLSSSITSTKFSQDTRSWHVCIDRDGQSRTMTVKHLVFATGFGGGYPKIPDIPGKELFRGSILHSTEYGSAGDYEGKKVIVVGAGNSGHDIAHDFCYHGWDVTMIQRSPTYVISREAVTLSHADTYNDHFPIEFADVLGVALPFATQKCLLTASVARNASGIDKKLLDDLATAGFQTYHGPDGAGLLPLKLERSGAFYIDTGTSREIIDGAIKVKNTRGIRRFTEGGVELEDETVLEGDVVVLATGFGGLRDSVVEVCGPDAAKKVGKVWGLDVEGELHGTWRRTGHPRLWIAYYNLSLSRFHSLHLALQIKAIEEGIVHDEAIYTCGSDPGDRDDVLSTKGAGL